MNAGTIKRNKGFTIIEMLVVMVLLAMLVASVSKAFQQSSIAWDSGWRRVEVIMVGRAVTDFIVRELEKTVYDPNESVSLSGDDITDPGEDDDNGFWIHDGTNGLYQVEYELDGDYLERAVPEGTGKMFRNDDGRLEIRDLDIEFMPSSDDPQYATIEFDIYTKDKGIEHTMAFSTRAFLVNKHRYYHEQEDE